MQQFLTNLLPGLRDARAPLAAGYVWLLALWLLLANELPTRDEATGVLAAVYRLGEILGPISIGLVVSFAAYLVGVVSQTVTDEVLRVASTRRVSRGYLSRSRIPLSGSSYISARRYVASKVDDEFRRLREGLRNRNVALLDFVAENFEIHQSNLRRELHESEMGLIKDVAVASTQRRSFKEIDLSEFEGFARARFDLLRSLQDAISKEPPNMSEAEIDEFLQRWNASERVTEMLVGTDTAQELEDHAKGHLVDQLFDELIVQLHLIEARLMNENPEQYGRVDRLNSESELRLALSFPLIVLAVVLSFTVSWFCLAIFLPVLLLVVSGWIRGRDAGDTLIDALQTTESLVPPAIQDLQRQVERATREPGAALPEGRT